MARHDEGEAIGGVENEPVVRAAPAAPASLIAIYGPSLGSRIDLDSPETVIGRGPRCDVVLPVRDVSRRHTRIQRTGGGWIAEDLGSTNGTYINDERLDQGAPHALRAGDLLNVARVIFEVLDGDHIEASYHEAIHRIAIVDGLTQISNPRYLEEFMTSELPRARRYGRPLAMLLLDVDHLKSINDQCGHVAGDHVLREIAQVVGSGLRGECCFARHGGKKFAVVLPETSLSDARIVAERVRGLVDVHEFRAGERVVPVTISIGVSALDERVAQAAPLYQCADQRLYEAKSAGRNCVRSGSE